MAVVDDSVQHSHHEVTPTQSPSQTPSTIPPNLGAGTVLDGSRGNPAQTSETGMYVSPQCTWASRRDAAGGCLQVCSNRHAQSFFGSSLFVVHSLTFTLSHMLRS